jgi:2-succinyl-6-hydroxy-2,4-cyclohexadiene-1-carboxylate synthase
MVFVPGFSQTAAVWDEVRAALPDDVASTALDVPDGLDFAATAAAIGDGGGEGVYVGYSMGGRLCLQLALDRPGLVEALVLVSATAGIADDAQRAARRESDDALAVEIGRDGAAAFLERWVSQPLFATLPPGRAAHGRLGAGDERRLAHQMRELGQGRQPPLWERLEELDMPVALVTGLADEKYDGLADQMFELIDDCVHLRIEGGHSLPLERPLALAGALTTFVHDITE